MVVIWGLRDEARPADAIVVLGAAQWDGRPSPVLRARLEHAHVLWSEGLAPWLVVTGGVGAGDTTSEAVVSRRFLAQLGVPVKSVLLEANAARVPVNPWCRCHAARATVVARTSGEDPFHMLAVSSRAVRSVHSLRTRTSPIRERTELTTRASRLVRYLYAPEAAVASLRNAVAR